MGYSGAGGKLINEKKKKNHKQKISWHCPFKGKTVKIEKENNCNIINTTTLLAKSEKLLLTNFEVVLASCEAVLSTRNTPIGVLNKN